MNDVISLTEKLVAIASYVDNGCDETAVVAWLEQWFVTNLPDMKLTRQPLSDGRANLYVGAPTPIVLFVGHIDTVPISDGWQTPPLTLTRESGRLYGLGVADMKGSIASLLVALTRMSKSARSTVGMLIYVDEEYRFAGMKQVIADKLFVDQPPELVISLDGNLQPLMGCRGLIKMDIEVIGKSGHASNPSNGVNAIAQLMESLASLEQQLTRYTSPELGQTTMNIAYLRGGATTDVDNPEILQRSGNVIPNYAEGIIELRVADMRLTAQLVETLLRQLLQERSLEVKSIRVGADLGAWNQTRDTVSEQFLKTCYTQAGILWQPDDPRYRGYIDVQLLAEVIPSPIYVIGAGGDNRHGANESAAIGDLQSAANLYQLIVEQWYKENSDEKS